MSRRPRTNRTTEGPTVTNPRDPRSPGPDGASDPNPGGTPAGSSDPTTHHPLPQVPPTAVVPTEIVQRPTQVTQPRPGNVQSGPVRQQSVGAQYGQQPPQQFGPGQFAQPQFAQQQFAPQQFGSQQFALQQGRPLPPPPVYGAPPVNPQGPPFGPPGYRPPQDAHGYGAQAYGMPGYGMPGYGVGYGPPPKKSRVGWIAGAVVLVAAVVAGTVLAVVQPWRSEERGPTVEAFELDHNVTAQVEIPEDWHAQEGSVEGTRTLILTPEDDNRTPGQIDQDLERMSEGDSITPIHMVVAQVGSCPASVTAVQVGTWRVDDIDSAELSGRQVRRQPSLFKVDGSSCLQLVGVDTEDGGGMTNTDGTDMGRELADVERVTASKTV